MQFIIFRFQNVWGVLVNLEKVLCDLLHMVRDYFHIGFIQNQRHKTREQDRCSKDFLSTGRSKRIWSVAAWHASKKRTSKGFPLLDSFNVDGGECLGILDWITVSRELNLVLGTVDQGELEEVLDAVSGVAGYAVSSACPMETTWTLWMKIPREEACADACNT